MPDDISLKEFVERALDELNKRYDVRFTASEKAVETALMALNAGAATALAASEKALDKADTSIEKRLDLLNEFRSAMRDRENDYVTKSQLYAAIMAIVAIIMAVVAVATLFLRSH